MSRTGAPEPEGRCLSGHRLLGMPDGPNAKPHRSLSRPQSGHKRIAERRGFLTGADSPGGAPGDQLNYSPCLGNNPRDRSVRARNLTVSLTKLAFPLRHFPCSLCRHCPMAVAAPVNTPHDPQLLCRHCGDECGATAIVSARGSFCCRGCESVFAILSIVRARPLLRHRRCGGHLAEDGRDARCRPLREPRRPGGRGAPHHLR